MVFRFECACGRSGRSERWAVGPVRLRDFDEAQALLVNLAKDMAAKGEITLTKNRADDELVY